MKYRFVVSEHVSFRNRIDIDKDSQFDLVVNDKIAQKLIDKKEFEISLKRRKYLISKEVMDTKKFKLSGLATTCDMTKELLIANFPITFSFHMREPIRQKEIE